MQTAPAPQTEPSRWQRFQPVAKLRAWGATLKPNSPLRSEPPATVAVLRALVNLGHGEHTYVQIGKAAGGVSWQQVGRVIRWAKARRYIGVMRLPRGKGQHYTLFPSLGENFLGAPALKKRRDDISLKSHQGRRDFQSLPSRKSAPRCDAAPTPRPPPQTGAGVSADTGAVSQPGREAVRRAAPENFAARSTPGPADAPGRVQRSTPAAAPPRRKPTAEEIAAAEAAFRECREILAKAPVPPRTRAPPGRRRH